MGRNKLGLLIFLAVVFVCLTSGRRINRGSTQAIGLVMWYPLDGNGRSFGFQSDMWMGINSRDTLRGDAYVRSNDGLVCDGTGDFLSIVHNSRHEITDRFTISLWVYPDNLTTSSRHIFSKVNGTFTNNNYAILWEYSGENDQVSLFAGGFSGTDPRTGSQMTLSPANNWYHIVYTYDGATLSGYRNGFRVVNTAKVFSLSIASNSYLSIGGNYQFGNHFQGKIKDVRLYNRCLTSSEVMDIYLYPKKIEQ